MKLIAFINLFIVCFTIEIGNKIEYLKAKIKLRVLVWKAYRNKISKDEFMKLGQVLIEEYGKWRNESMERIDKASRNLKKFIKGE